MLEVAEDGLARSVTGLAEDANVSPAVVRGLIQAGALMPTELPEFAPFRAPDAGFRRADAESRIRQRAAASCATRWRRRNFPPHLLDGVTGSGKTEVYFEAVAEALRAGQAGADPAAGNRADGAVPGTLRGALRRAARRNGIRDLSQKERRRTYRAVMNGEARVVVGARSSLFLPFPNWA